MSGCTIISDSHVKEILIRQTRKETLDFLQAVSQCLSDYSLSAERSYQPKSSVVVRPNGQKALWRPFTAASNVGCKIIVDPAADAAGKKPPLHGVLVTTDDKGMQTGVINAEEVTAYRTSLATMIPFMARERVRHVVVFGAGKQALWHLRLALVLRGEEIERVTLVNRSGETGEALLSTVKADNEQRWHSQARLTGLYPSDLNYDEELEKLLGHADVVFCTVPSTQPLFPAKYVQQRSADAGQPLLTAIGSWQPNMIELDPALVKHALQDADGEKVLLVDDRVGCLDHAGEVVQCELKEEQLVEVGEIFEGADVASGRSEGFRRWVRTGLVVYKSVGVSVIDLTAGNRLLALAKEKGLGTTVEGF